MRNQKDEMKKVMISIKGLPGFAEDEDDGFELLTDGEYLQTDDSATFSYLESSLTGAIDDRHLTVFNVEPGRITLKREHEFGVEMIFSETQKHHFLQSTPFGVVMLGINTQSITKDINEQGGNIEIRYNIEVDNIAVSRNTFKINISTLPQ